MRGEILGVERRRRWSDEEKLSIVTAAGIDGATVTLVAQRHDVTRQQVYAWRHELKKKGLWSPDNGAVFLPLDFPAEADVPVEPTAVRPGPVELRLTNGRCGLDPAGVDPFAEITHPVTNTAADLDHRRTVTPYGGNFEKPLGKTKVCLNVPPAQKAVIVENCLHRDSSVLPDATQCPR